MQIKHGTTRKVLLVGRYAIKFPNWDEYRLFLNGLLCNMQEARWWREMPEARRMMCPVLFSIWGGWLVVMPRCEPISRKSFGQLKRYPIGKTTARGYRTNMFIGYDTRYNRAGIPVEYKLDSYGRYRGRIVALDYGS